MPVMPLTGQAAALLQRPYAVMPYRAAQAAALTVM
jgi:hypothetical protein